MFSCRLVPEKIQCIVDKTADCLLVKKVEEFTADLLEQINDLIKSVTGIDFVLLLRYLVLISVLIWLIDTIKHILRTYTCWFRCNKSSSSSCSSSSSSSSCSSSSSYSRCSSSSRY
jgi:hypothetical protein